MAGLADILGGLGGIGEGYLRGTNQLQQIQSQQYAQALRALAMQQQMKAQQSAPAAFQTLIGGGLDNLMGGGGGQVPSMAPGQIEQEPLPPVPQAAQQMAAGPGDVRGSWFGNSPGWSDPSDSGLQAGGQPVSAGPGIALPDRSTLGQLFNVRAPSGQTLTLPQTDIGPAKWTGRGVDINSPAAAAFGYTPKDFPTDQTFHVALADFKSSIPPEASKEGLSGARNVLQGSGNPLTLVGRYDPTSLARAIKQANPDQSDEVNMAAFDHLFPLLSNAGKAQFAQQWEAYKFGVQQTEHASEFKQRQESLDQNRQFMQDIARERVGQGQQKIGQEQRRMDMQSGAADPSTIDAVAKGIAEYRQAPLSGWTMRSPWGQQVMAKVYSDNPDYSAAQYAAGVSGARAFASGRQSDTVRSMSVAIDHLQVAEDLGKALQTGDSRALNAASAALQNQFGYEGPADFNTAKMIVSDEVTKAVAGGNLSMTERTALQNQFSTASSPEQLNGVIGTLKRLLGGQLRGLQRQYENIPGTKPPFENKLSPQAKGQLSGAGAAVQSMPVPDQFKDEADGTSFQGQDGNVWVKKGSQMIMTPGAEVLPSQ